MQRNIQPSRFFIFSDNPSSSVEWGVHGVSNSNLCPLSLNTQKVYVCVAVGYQRCISSCVEEEGAARSVPYSLCVARADLNSGVIARHLHSPLVWCQQQVYSTRTCIFVSLVRMHAAVLSIVTVNRSKAFDYIPEIEDQHLVRGVCGCQVPRESSASVSTQHYSPVSTGYWVPNPVLCGSQGELICIPGGLRVSRLCARAVSRLCARAGTSRLGGEGERAGVDRHMQGGDV